MTVKCYCQTPAEGSNKFCTRCGGTLSEQQKEPSERPTRNVALVWAAAGVIGIVILGLILLVPTQPSKDSTSESTREALTNSLASAITRGIEEEQDVLDAAIVQDGAKIRLVLVVPYRTSEARARNLADNFVRMAKSTLRDGGVEKRIGRGGYDYLVGVYYPNEEQVLMGAKARSSDRISW